MWINPETGQVFQAHYEIRSAFPQVSFPDSMTEQNIADMGLLPVQATPAPAYDPLTQDLVELPPIHDEVGWVQQWSVQDVSEEEAAERLNAKRAAMEVSPLQAQAALLIQGLLPQVEALINDPQTDPLVKLAWNKASTFRRMSPMILGMATTLGWTDQQLDDLFALADTIEV